MLYFYRTCEKILKSTCRGQPVALTNSQVAANAMGPADTPLMPQLAGEALRIKAICVSPEWCAIDKTALRQFVSICWWVCVCVFECIVVHEHTDH